MTKDQEVSRWYAEQLGVSYYELYEDGVGRFPKDINDPACQMAIIKWHCKLNKYNTVTHYYDEVVIEKNRGDYISEHNGTTIKDALIALREAMKDE